MGPELAHTDSSTNSKAAASQNIAPRLRVINIPNADDVLFALLVGRMH
jgi:hypothetical protein